jgi:HlyD family secretion protein
MDRKIEKRRWPARRLWAVAGGAAVVATLTFLLVSSPRGNTLRIDPARITVAQVKHGEFHEYIPVLGVVEPIVTVFLDAVEGGVVEEIVAEDGRPIEQGDLILRLSNSALLQNTINTESVLLENINTLRNTRINLAEKELILKEVLLDTDYRIVQLEKQQARYDALMADGVGALSQSEFEAVVDELNYQRGRRAIIEARIVQERALREQQLEQVDRTIARVERNLDIIAQTLDALEVRAPISGYLSPLRVELGQSVARGQNIGQIDVLDRFKVRADIDQHYIARVVPGLRGDFRFANQTHALEIAKIFPEVANDVFKADLEFVGDAPAGLRRGQSLRVNLSLGGSSESLLVERGGFHRSTGGRWVFEVTPDGRRAHRRAIRIGRQNPQYFELLEGLAPGARVITSSYDGFGDAQEIVFSESLGSMSGTSRSADLAGQ